MVSSLHRFLAPAVLLVLLSGTAAALAQPTPLTNSFTYQGELAAAGVPATGTYDIRFRLFDAASAGNQIGSTMCSDNVNVSNGRFTAALDFGAVFAGQARFLEIEVRADAGLDCSDASEYTVLSPRQELTATPNANFAQSAASSTTAVTASNATSLNGQPASFFTNASNLTGTLPSYLLSGAYSSPLTLSNPANIFFGNGAAITNLSAANFSTGTLANARTTGTNLNNPNTLVLRDASGNFSAGTITASFNGNATTATTATNATQLNSQVASFYTNASNITTGTLGAARIPDLDASKIAIGTLADARLSSNVALLSNPGPSQFAGAVGIGIAPTGGARFAVMGGYDLANPVEDQSQLARNTGTANLDQWQSFTAARTGPLTGVRLRVTSPLGPSPALGTIRIYAGEGTAGPLLWSQAVTYVGADFQLQQFNFSTPPNVTAGLMYTIRFSTPSTNRAWVDLNGANAYTRGRYSGDANFDAVFETLVGLPRPAITVADSGVSIGAAAPPPASNGLSVSGASVFAADVTAQSFNVINGVIQRGGAAITGTADLGLYSQVSGNFVRFVTNNGEFHWSTDGGIGTNDRMVLFPNGNLSVAGSLAKAGGSFKIDHPLDPTNKYLYHSFVESPDMMNIYNGEVTTDGTGYVIITLPDYFEALNRDFRYQLTVIDDEDQSDAMVWAKVVRRIGVDGANTFTIRTFRPNVVVSWQVTGIRKDAWAEKNRIPNSVDKPASEKGLLLHPEAFGKGAKQDIVSTTADAGAPANN